MVKFVERKFIKQGEQGPTRDDFSAGGGDECPDWGQSRARDAIGNIHTTTLAPVTCRGRENERSWKSWKNKVFML